MTRPMTAEEIQSAYEWETGNVIAERFKHLNPTEVCAVLVNSHGPFVWGPTGKKAVENALALEIVAEMALKAIQLNPQVQPISSHRCNQSPATCCASIFCVNTDQTSTMAKIKSLAKR